MHKRVIHFEHDQSGKNQRNAWKNGQHQARDAQRDQTYATCLANRGLH